MTTFEEVREMMCPQCWEDFIAEMGSKCEICGELFCSSLCKEIHKKQVNDDLKLAFGEKNAINS